MASMKWTRFPASQYANFAAEWDRLSERAAPAMPFLRAAFIQPLIKYFGDGSEVVVVGDDGGQVNVAAVMRRVRTGVWETFQPSQLPLGAILMDRGVELAQVLPQMLAAMPHVGLSVGITQLDPLLVARPTSGARLQTLDYIETAWIPVEGTFEAYWEARGKNLRHNIRKQRSKLSDQGISTRLETLTHKSDVESVVKDYSFLESAGWKAAHGTSIHVDNEQGRFYREMLESYCAAGEGRLYRYWFGDKPVAVDLCISSGQTLVVLKTTYAESIQGFSPAFLMRHEAFADIFREGRIRRIEFYGRVMDWHKRWTDESRTLYHSTFYRWKWLLGFKEARARRRLAAEPAKTVAPAGEAASSQ
jgi:CelD/BcsL family acetyltransferase involved in cellulose biosynthesis